MMRAVSMGVLAAGALLAVLFGGVTWFALEASGVAIITTTAADGTLRETHVWFTELDGEPWLEAGAPGNPWYLDVLGGSELVIVSEGGPTGRFRALPSPDRSADVRASLRSKYGWRDRFVGMFVGASRSTAVRLVEAGS